jgi:hypothetical protein
MANNIVPVSFSLNGLFKRLNYNFEIEGLGGNWPATALPISGQFTASSKSGLINAAVSFCATTGGCLGDTDILPYDLAKKCTFDQSQIFTFVRMKATLADDPTIFVYSDPVYVTCSTCLPNTRISIPTTNTLNRNSKNTFEFLANITGLIPKEKYTFTYSSVDSNWPVKIYPITGTILPSASSYTLPSKLLFCNNTGVCPEESNNVLQYSPDPACLNHSYYSSIKLTITPENCAFDNAESNIMHIKCSDCIPRPIAAIPSRIELTSGTNNYGEFTAIVTGILPDKEYSYRFRSLDSNWPILLENTTGLFSSPTDVYCIESSIKFCEHTGVCLSGGNNILDFAIPENCILEPNDYEARIILDINSLDCSENVVSSNIMNFNCTDCFPPSVEISFDHNPVYLSKDETYELTTSFTNLDVNKLYYYRVEPTFSNWPLFIDNQSGYIQTNATHYDLISTLSFCASTGVCPSGYVGVFNYILDTGNIVPRYIENNKVYSILELVLQEADCPAKTYTSSRLMLQCNDCRVGGNISLVSVDITP